MPYPVRMLSDIAARVLDAVGIQKPESGCRRILPRRGSRPADRARPSHPREPTRAAGDRLWGRRGSRSPPRCHPNLDDTEPRHTVAPSASVGRALADRCHLLVQHPRSRLHRRTTLVICGDHDRAVPPANSRLLAARIRDARLITIQAGHDLQKPGPAEIVAQLVEQFLDSDTSMAGCQPKARAISAPPGMVSDSGPAADSPAAVAWSSGAMTAGSMRRTA